MLLLFKADRETIIVTMQEITPESIAALLQKLKQTPSVRKIEREADLYNAELSRIAKGAVPN